MLLPLLLLLLLSAHHVRSTDTYGTLAAVYAAHLQDKKNLSVA